MIAGRQIALYSALAAAVIAAVVLAGYLDPKMGAAIEAIVVAALNLIAANNVTSTATTQIAPRNRTERHASSVEHVAAITPDIVAHRIPSWPR